MNRRVYAIILQPQGIFLVSTNPYEIGGHVNNNEVKHEEDSNIRQNTLNHHQIRPKEFARFHQEQKLCPENKASNTKSLSHSKQEVWISLEFCHFFNACQVSQDEDHHYYHVWNQIKIHLVLPECKRMSCNSMILNLLSNLHPVWGFSGSFL